jgi:DNA-binding MarR family transcriptional regulator
MSTSPADEIARDCLAVRARLLARALTGVYDRALAPHGLTVAQLNLLAALGKLGPSAPGHLGRVLVMERSTVSRNLDLLLAAGWVESTAEDDRGLREVALTSAGRAKVAAALPAWKTAQAEAGELLGPAGAAAVRTAADAVWGSAAD